jgi:hypothetical protein
LNVGAVEELELVVLPEHPVKPTVPIARIATVATAIHLLSFT